MDWLNCGAIDVLGPPEVLLYLFIPSTEQGLVSYKLHELVTFTSHNLNQTIQITTMCSFILIRTQVRVT